MIPSDDLLRITLAHVSDGVLTTDAQGLVTSLNPVAEALTGWTSPEACGLSVEAILEIIDAETRVPVDSTALGALQQGCPVSLPRQSILISRDGSERFIDDTAVPVHADDGSIMGAVVVFRDVSERKQAESALLKSELQFRRLLEVLPAGAYTCNPEGLITYFNHHAVQIWGRAPKLNDSVDRFCGSFKLYAADGSPITHDHCWMAQALRTETEYNGHEIIIERPDGSRLTVLAYANPLHDRSGKLIGAVNVLVDITDRQRTEQALKEADRRKNEFLAILAHELRNPLAPIGNASRILRQRCPEDAETRWAQDVIERQVEQMTRLVDDLLDISRLTRGKITLRKEPVAVSKVVNRALEMARPLFASRNHDLTVTSPDEPLHLNGDPARLAQVLTNLLNNAAKYTEKGGRIWLTVLREGDEVVFKIRDTGIGMPVAFLPRAFELFSQEDDSLERTQGGLGIGLTLVRNLVRLHGGSVSAHSPGPGQGSEFTVRLPLWHTAVPLAEPTPRPAPPPKVAATPRRILVVDDNVDAATTLAILLRNWGHDVQTAGDGEAALEAARGWTPDVVLLDIGLPRLSGLEVARRMREELALTAAFLVAVTGYGQDEDRHRSRDAGFDAHLVKPVDLDDLLELLVRSAHAR